MGIISKNVNLAIAAILIVAVGIPIVQGSYVTSYEEAEYSWDHDGDLPETVQVEPYGMEVVEDSTSVYLNDTEESLDSNVTWDYEDGEVTLESDASVTEGDTVVAEYEYKPSNYLSGMTAMIISFVPIGMAAMLLMAAFSGFMS